LDDLLAISESFAHRPTPPYSPGVISSLSMPSFSPTQHVLQRLNSQSNNSGPQTTTTMTLYERELVSIVQDDKVSELCEALQQLGYSQTITDIVLHPITLENYTPNQRVTTTPSRRQEDSPSSSSAEEQQQLLNDPHVEQRQAVQECWDRIGKVLCGSFPALTHLTIVYNWWWWRSHVPNANTTTTTTTSTTTNNNHNTTTVRTMVIDLTQAAHIVRQVQQVSSVSILQQMSCPEGFSNSTVSLGSLAMTTTTTTTTHLDVQVVGQEALAKALKCHSSLVSLNMRLDLDNDDHNTSNKSTWQPLFKAITTLSQLTTLELGNVHLKSVKDTGHSDPDTAQESSESVKAFESTGQDDDECSFLRLPSLRYVYLQHIELSSNFWKALKHSTTDGHLTTVVLCQCPLAQTAKEAALDFIGSLVMTVSTTSHPSFASGTSASQVSSLRSLQLDACHWSDDIMSALLQVSMQNLDLQVSVWNYPCRVAPPTASWSQLFAAVATMNRAGRVEYLRQKPECSESAIHVLQSVPSSLDAIYLHLRENPRFLPTTTKVSSIPKSNRPKIVQRKRLGNIGVTKTSLLLGVLCLALTEGFSSIPPKRRNVNASPRARSFGTVRNPTGGGQTRLSRHSLSNLESDTPATDGSYGSTADVTEHTAIPPIASLIGSSTSIVVSMTFFAVLAWKRDALMVSFFIGAIGNGILSKILKRVLKQSRPPELETIQRKIQPSDGGMPSSHGMSLGFLSIFTALCLPWTRLLLVPYVSTSLWYRVESKLHTWLQILAGWVLGTINGILWYKFCQDQVQSWVSNVLLNDQGVLPWPLLAVPALLGLAVVGSFERRISYWHKQRSTPK